MCRKLFIKHSKIVLLWNHIFEMKLIGQFWNIKTQQIKDLRKSLILILRPFNSKSWYFTTSRYYSIQTKRKHPCSNTILVFRAAWNVFDTFIYVCRLYFLKKLNYAGKTIIWSVKFVFQYSIIIQVWFLTLNIKTSW